MRKPRGCPGGVRPFFLLLALVSSLVPLVAQTNTAADTNAAPAALTNALSSTNAATLNEALTASTNAAAAPAGSFTPARPPTMSTPTMQLSGNGPDDEIADIRPPVFHLRATSPWLFFLIAAAMLAVVAAVCLLWPRRDRQLSAKSAYDLALEKLDQARALMLEEQPIPYAVLVSETVRSYLGQRFHAPSARRTTEEFLRQMETDPATPLAHHRDLLRDFLQACDLVKFARYQPTQGELASVQERALRFVQATRPEPVQNGSHA
jgi:hypothetical protein